ncbi:hypothetical protein BRC93_10570 [Halobacteriales archaeon QS_5_70_15]|nr:MAG: hypothetical protein BRC93_10570 [Halobacteriales archaeon QS_5_70_15]
MIDPAFPHSPEQVTAVESFADDGGRVVLLGEPTRVDVATGPFGGSLVDVRSRLGRLGDGLGVAFGTDYLYDEVNNEGNYKRVLADGRGDLDDARAALYTATTVEAPGGERLLVTPETTRLSVQSGARRRPVAVRTGNVVAVGDTTFLTGAKPVVADNGRLARVIAAFAVGGDRIRDVADFPYFLPDEPRIRYSSAGLLDATKDLAREVRASGRPGGVAPTGRSVAPRRTEVLVTTFEDLERTNAPETGIEVTATTVSVPGYDGSRNGVAVVHRPEGPVDLVVAASSPERAAAVVRALGDGSIREETLSSRTAVTAAPAEEDGGGVTEPPTGGEPAPPPTGNESASSPERVSPLV